MSRDDAMSDLFRAVSDCNVQCDTVQEIFTFALGFFSGRGLSLGEAKRFAIDAAANGYWPQLDSLEIAADIAK